MPNKLFVIAVSGRTWLRGVRGSSRQQTFYITGLRYRDGDGLKIKSFTYSEDKSKAKQFGKLNAETYVKQIHTIAWVEAA